MTSNICKIDPQSILGLGLHYTQHEWTLSQVREAYEETESEDLNTLINLSESLEIEDDTLVLGTYTNKNKETVFSCPRIHLDSDSNLCLFLASDTKIELTFDPKSKTYLTEKGISFKIECYRDKESKEIKKISLVTTLAISIDDFEEDWSCYIPVLTLKDVDLKGLATALQKGEEVPEKSLVQIGSGGGYTVAFKPYMLKPGFYKITSMYEPFMLPSGGKIWKGVLSPVSNDGIVDDSVTYDVRMNSGPFIRKGSETLVKSALNNKPVYVYLDGGFNTSMGVAAIGHCSILPEIDGVVSKEVWNKFVNEARKFCVGVRRMNTKDLLKPHEIEALKNEYFANSGNKTSLAPIETETKETVSNEKSFIEIPF